MSPWMTREVMRRSLRFCINSWKHYRTFADNSRSTKQQLVLNPYKIQLLQVESLRSSVKFHWQDSSLGELDKNEPAATPVAGSLEQRARSPLFSELEKCGSPSDVLDLSQRYPPSPRGISNYFTYMWTSVKKMSDEQRRCELQLMLEHPAFELLLQNAMTNVGSMQPEDVAYSLLSMINLGVPQKSRVVQLYLRACQETLNDFDEKSLSILASCLDRMESTANVDALKHGLRLVIEVRLPMIKSVLAFQTMMRLLGKDMSPDLKRKLVRKAFSMKKQFSLPNAQHMISTMAKMDFYSKPLLDICSQRIVEDLHGTPFNRLLKVMLACREVRYRDLALLTGISDYVASTVDVWTQKEVVIFLSTFESFGFSSGSLMEAFAQKVMANPDTLTLKDLLCVLKVYSSLNYSPQHDRETFLQSLNQTLDFYLPRMSDYQLFKACYCLSLLGYFPSAPIEKLLQGSTLEMLSSRDRHLKKLEQMVQTVHMCLRLDRPVLSQTAGVPACVLGEVTSGHSAENQRLSRVLRRVLSHRADVALQEMVVVENVYFLDAVISKTMINQTSDEEKQAQRMAVLCPAPSAFCFGTTHPRGPLAVKLRHLKILGYLPIMITEQELTCEEKAAQILTERIFTEIPAPT
ncbi:FAST kinase domain-containing protein 2, mitochondrial isoform X2 [Corythoichthys intestinalis]|uniref:FAST kinase domain-containing protein 2, mitochondrial isoform X2 n=1 Tax=Corythoichthys intestinalis TaxID=161448 RepID=UPI0025A62B02|nr:FAST kinase domain-containing protein 2, mitochondrial isoform X2 [Corythoichthys intestinalis]